MLFCINLPNFIQIIFIRGGNAMPYQFQDGGRQPCWIICFGVMADHAPSVFCGLSSVFKSLVDLIVAEILRICDRFLHFGWNCLFTPLLGSFWGIFSSDDVTHHRDLQGSRRQKDVLGQKHVVWAIQRKNRCNGSSWAHDKKTRGQSNLTKSASRGAHSPVRGHPGGRKLYHWTSGVGFPISVP